VSATPTILYIMKYLKKHCPRLTKLLGTAYKAIKIRTMFYQDNQVSTPGLIPGIKPPLL
jgi:hypothetical protein